MKQKLIVILGPTASGKSAFAVKLAKRFKGEIISADSRQVYKGLDIGSGKITKKEMAGIPHHLLDVASPQKRFTVAQYCRLAKNAMAEITRHGNIPFIVGGSPLYIYAVVDGWIIPEVKPNEKLRKKLNNLTIAELFSQLKKLDPQRAETIEQKNKRRLIRALEIVMTTKKPVPQFQKHPLPYPVLFLGIKRLQENLKKQIQKRISLMFRQGLLREVKKLRDSGLSWKRIEEFGFEYRFIVSYLRKGLTLARVAKVRPLQEELKAKIQKATEDFARRQMTWFKKDRRIHWIGNPKEAQRYLRSFLKIS